MESLKQNLATTLLELAEFYPDWRFGQLVENIAAWAGETEPGNAWDITDADLLRTAREHIRRKRDEAGKAHGSPSLAPRSA